METKARTEQVKSLPRDSKAKRSKKEPLFLPISASSYIDDEAIESDDEGSDESMNEEDKAFIDDSGISTRQRRHGRSHIAIPKKTKREEVIEIESDSDDLDGIESVHDGMVIDPAEVNKNTGTGQIDQEAGPTFVESSRPRKTTWAKPPSLPSPRSTSNKPQENKPDMSSDDLLEEYKDYLYSEPDKFLEQVEQVLDVDPVTMGNRTSPNRSEHVEDGLDLALEANSDHMGGDVEMDDDDPQKCHGDFRMDDYLERSVAPPAQGENQHDADDGSRELPDEHQADDLSDASSDSFGLNQYIRHPTPDVRVPRRASHEQQSRSSSPRSVQSGIEGDRVSVSDRRAWRLMPGDDDSE
jgi:hypothetical protein